MQKKGKKEKNIAERQNTSILEPNYSLGNFVFGSDIAKYLKKSSFVYEENPDKEKGYGYDSYYFDKLKLEVWTDANGIVECVRSEHDCYWKNVNIVGLRYERFKDIFHLIPDNEDICYLLDGRSQHVYDFESIGLQVWVWYGIIRTVIASRLTDE